MRRGDIRLHGVLFVRFKGLSGLFLEVIGIVLSAVVFCLNRSVVFVECPSALC